jgi:hypothetical protein
LRSSFGYEPFGRFLIDSSREAIGPAASLPSLVDPAR